MNIFLNFLYNYLILRKIDQKIIQSFNIYLILKNKAQNIS